MGYIIIVTEFAFIVLITVATSFYIFACRRKTERPEFVTMLLIFLNAVWICYVVYFVTGSVESEHLTKKTEPSSVLLPEVNKVLNDIATIGNVLYLLHDWIFTY